MHVNKTKVISGTYCIVGLKMFYAGTNKYMVYDMYAEKKLFR